MPVIESERQKAVDAERARRIKSMEETLENAKSASRLAANSDWKRMSKSIADQLVGLESEKLSIYDKLINSVVTDEEKLGAVQTIKMIELKIYDFKYLLGYPQSEIAAGESAAVELARLKEEKNA